MSETVIIVAIAATVFGAILSTLKGFFTSKDTGIPYSISKLMSSLIVAVMASIAIVNFGLLQDQLTQIGLVGLAVFQLAAGFGIDQGLSRLDK